jgi:hypothetical protein
MRCSVTLLYRGVCEESFPRDLFPDVELRSTHRRTVKRSDRQPDGEWAERTCDLPEGIRLFWRATAPDPSVFVEHVLSRIQGCSAELRSATVSASSRRLRIVIDKLDTDWAGVAVTSRWLNLLHELCLDVEVIVKYFDESE